MYGDGVAHSDSESDGEDEHEGDDETPKMLPPPSKKRRLAEENPKAEETSSIVGMWCIVFALLVHVQYFYNWDVTSLFYGVPKPRLTPTTVSWGKSEKLRKRRRLSVCDVLYLHFQAGQDTIWMMAKGSLHLPTASHALQQQRKSVNTSERRNAKDNHERRSLPYVPRKKFINHSESSSFACRKQWKHENICTWVR